MKLMVLNGPNLNMLGIREPNIYGQQSYETLKQMISDKAKEKQIEIDVFQSNHEGDLVDYIQKAYFEKYDGIVFNPAAYTHTSLAIADAIKAISPLPVVEVHISDISKREDFRHHSYITPYCIQQICGYGLQGYLMAIDVLCAKL